MTVLENICCDSGSYKHLIASFLLVCLLNYYYFLLQVGYSTDAVLFKCRGFYCTWKTEDRIDRKCYLLWLVFTNIWCLLDLHSCATRHKSGWVGITFRFYHYVKTFLSFVTFVHLLFYWKNFNLM